MNQGAEILELLAFRGVWSRSYSACSAQRRLRGQRYNPQRARQLHCNRGLECVVAIVKACATTDEMSWIATRPIVQNRLA